MTFRKDSLSFYQSQTAYIITIVLCLALVSMLELRLFLLCTFPLVVLVLVNSKLFYNEFVTIDNTGISCFKKEKVIWEYEWEKIIELKGSSRYRMRSVEIVIDDNAKEVVPFDYSIHYFQLGNAAMNAIAQYCPVGKRGTGLVCKNLNEK